MTIKAIETSYKGYRFRSRLEARWAVFFDAEGITWEYEKEGYELPSGRYLPDFWLRPVKMWAEIKPGFSVAEIKKCQELAIGTGYPCLLINGLPDGQNFWACMPISETDETNATPPFCDFVIDGSTIKDGRFYSCTGQKYPSQARFGAPSNPSVIAALSARFEHGESR